MSETKAGRSKLRVSFGTYGSYEHPCIWFEHCNEKGRTLPPAHYTFCGHNYEKGALEDLKERVEYALDNDCDVIFSKWPKRSQK
jgi:hypothetical protein